MDMVDVAVQFNDSLDEGSEQQIEASLRKLDGVISVHIQRARPHPAMLVQINPERLRSDAVLDCIRAQGVEARVSVPDRLSGVSVH
ncbi:MAG: hypothetical protein WCC36_00385 [Gammaproteobacteria bacterium]